MTTTAAMLGELLEKLGDETWEVVGDDRPDMEWNNHIHIEGTDDRVCFMAHNGPAAQDIFDARAKLIAIAPTVSRALLRDCAAKDKEIEGLRERLEMNHAYRIVDGKMARVSVELGSIPDGIECRDETIRQQDRNIDRLRSEVERLREALRALASDDGFPYLTNSEKLRQRISFARAALDQGKDPT